MKASRLATLAAAATLLLSFAGLPAAGQAGAPERGDAVKPIMAPAAAKKTAHTRTRQTTAKNEARVYLFRGLLNIFSMGMDELADKIKASGIPATVYNHTEWEELAGKIVADYKNGNHAPIVLIGHSLGADAVIFMAEYLGKYGVPVALVVPFDGTQTLVAPSNVARVMNITQRDYAYAKRGVGFRGELQNIDVSSQGVDHLNIDKSPRLHAMVLNKIVAVVKKGAVPAEFAVVPGDSKERAKPTPAPRPEAAGLPGDLAAKPQAVVEPENRPVEAAKPVATETAAKPVAAPKVEEKPVAHSAAHPAVSAAAAPVAEPVVAPAAAPVAPAAPVTPVAVSAPSTPPVSAPAASAPQTVSAPAAAATVTSAPRPATERLEYEKLVLPKH